MQEYRENRTSPEYKKRIRYEFESFCKLVIHSGRCDYLRRFLRRAEVEKDFSDFFEGFIENLRSEHGCPDEVYVFNICGYMVPIKDDRLVEQLLEMDQEGCSILVLAYAVGLCDREIGELLHTSRPRVQQLRNKFLQAIQKAMKE